MEAPTEQACPSIVCAPDSVILPQVASHTDVTEGLTSKEALASVTAPTAIVVATDPAELVTSPVRAGIRAAATVPALRSEALPDVAIGANATPLVFVQVNTPEPPGVVQSPENAPSRPNANVPLVTCNAAIAAFALTYVRTAAGVVATVDPDCTAGIGSVPVKAAPAGKADIFVSAIALNEISADNNAKTIFDFMAFRSAGGCRLR